MISSMNTMKQFCRTLSLLSALTIAGLGPATSSAQTPHTHQHSFSGAEQWSAYFDDPKRDEWQKPHEVLMALSLKPDARVADIGSGTGYFTVRLAHHVPNGRVYGVDLEPDMVKYLAERAKKAGLKNVTSILGTSESPKLPAKVDLVLMVDVFHHISDRDRYFKNLKGSLNPAGQIAIIDFNQASPIGPPSADRIPADQVKAEMSAAGYTVATEHTFLPNQYFLVFAPARP
jgi:cyclopropane fatty-acyl-phospholipid synthase-like methyltransferase